MLAIYIAIFPNNRFKLRHKINIRLDSRWIFKIKFRINSLIIHKQ